MSRAGAEAREAGGAPALLGSALRHPAIVPQALAVAIAVVVASDAGGHPIGRWAPGVLAILALLAASIVGLPRPHRPRRSIVVSLVALAVFTAWSYLSVLWAGVPGEAWTGANRTLGYAAAFALLVLWPPPPRAAVLLAAGGAAAIGVVAVVLLVRLAADAPPDAFVGTRLAAPSGYPNANTALWLLGAWPALVLAAGRGVPWWLRATMAGTAVALLMLALLGESRGAALATPLVVLLVLVALPGRVRNAAALAVVGGAAALAAPAALDVSATLGQPGEPSREQLDAALDAAVRATVLAALGAAVVVGAWARAEARRPSRRLAQIAHRAGAAALVVAATLGTLAAIAAAGDPAARVAAAWRSFESDYAAGPTDESRLTSGLGSGRHDFYRVALRAFREHPVRGEGVDNFRQRYLREGIAGETPRYPHSFPLALLSQVGIVGTLAFATFLAAAVAAARTALSRARGPEAAAAGAGLAAFASFALHGSVDWLFETGGLGLVAFAMLGLAAGGAAGRGGGPRPPLAAGRTDAAAVAVWCAILAAGVALPWLADRDVAAAGRAMADRPQAALARLDRAARLDPLALQPLLAEGTARLLLADLTGADAAFAAALRRVPDDQYATLMRGAIASARGRRSDARRLLERAAELAPRDKVTRAALRAARAGRVDLDALQRALVERAR